MAQVRLGADGEVEVIVPSTPEEVLEGELALRGVIQALAELMAERDFGLREGGEPPA